MKLLSWAFITPMSSYIFICARFSFKPRTSPLAIVTAHYKNTYLKITKPPQKNGRAIFGKLVPYGSIWRTGAMKQRDYNHQMIFSLMGTTLKAGTYCLFTTPGQRRWTIIFTMILIMGFIIQS